MRMGRLRMRMVGSWLQYMGSSSQHVPSLHTCRSHRRLAHRAQQGVKGVLKLHGNTLQGAIRALAAQQVQGDGLVLAVNLARGKLRMRMAASEPMGNDYTAGVV